MWGWAGTSPHVNRLRLVSLSGLVAGFELGAIERLSKDERGNQIRALDPDVGSLIEPGEGRGTDPRCWFR